MDIDFSYRTTEDGDPLECENCRCRSKVSMFDNTSTEEGRRDIWLCEVCSSSGLSLALTYPEQCSDITLYRSISQIANLLLDEIRGERHPDAE